MIEFALGASFGYISAHDDVKAWPVTAWIEAPHELLAWVGLARGVPRCAPQARA